MWRQAWHSYTAFTPSSGSFDMGRARSSSISYPLCCVVWWLSRSFSYWSHPTNTIAPAITTATRVIPRNTSMCCLFTAPPSRNGHRSLHGRIRRNRGSPRSRRRFPMPTGLPQRFGRTKTIARLRRKRGGIRHLPHPQLLKVQ